MRSTFLQIHLIFSSLYGYRLQFSILYTYFVNMVWHCAGRHCSSMYECACRLFAGTWRIVSVITTLYYVVIICHRQVWYRALSLRYACIRSSSIIFIPKQATFLSNFVFFARFQLPLLI